jgi:hypothetical protein
VEDFANIEQQKQNRHDLEQDHADAPLRALTEVFPKPRATDEQLADAHRMAWREGISFSEARSRLGQ